MLQRRRALLGISLLLAGLAACSDATTTGAGGNGGSGGVATGGATSAGASGSSATGGSTSGGNGGAGASGGSVAGAAGTAGTSFDASSPEGGDDDASGGCDTYIANLKKVGRNGLLTFQIVASVPAPPVRGVNTWTVTVTRADTSQVTEGLTGAVDMPDHNHPITVEPDAVYDAATQTYNVTPLYFFMPGRWRTVFTVTDGTDASPPIDTVDFIFCIN